MYEYNPFGSAKKINELTADDLSILRSVPEGWYIEYKQQIPNVKSISKSVSAFANTYGGWLFYGIAESKNGKRTADQFVGIPTVEIPASELAIRQAVSSSISPAPHFETTIINGPNETISLDADRSIIVVGIPRGNNAPYIQSSGAIYRRVADSSDPKPETDRHFLDLLWQRGKSQKEQFDEFIRREPFTSDLEKDVSFITITMLVDPFSEKSIYTKLDFKQFASIMGNGERATGGIPFNNIFTTPNGFIARQTTGNVASRHVFSWRYYGDCASQVTLPLNSHKIGDIQYLFNFLNGYEYAAPFMAACRKENVESAHVLDICVVYATLTSMLIRKKHLLEIEGLDFNFTIRSKYIM